MPRPTSRKKSAVSLALTALRESLSETQQQFAVRLGTSVVSVARWETSRPPTGKTLERLLKLAKRHHHAESARAFEIALENGALATRIRSRLGQISDPYHQKAAADKLATAYAAQLDLIKQIVTSEDSDQFLLIAAEGVKDHLLQLADLICYDGRSELTGGKRK